MIDAVWLQVLNRLPPELHTTLSLITVTGAELVIQQIFKMERDYLVIRARTSGTGDLGRTIILPFAQIDFMALGGKLSEEEVMKIFGEDMPEIALPQAVAYQAAPMPAPPPAPRPAASSTIAFASPAPQPAAVVEPPTPAPAEPPAPAKPGQISKTILLARLRERLAEKAR